MQKSAAKILVVDDEREITDLIALYLEREGFQVHTADNGTDAVRMAQSLQPDLVVLDVLLGQPDGLEVCRTLRGGRCPTVPILFLSAKSEDGDIVAGLSEGGDDYMTKPFSPSQLVARVHAHLRRSRMYGSGSDPSSNNRPSVISWPGLTIDFRSLEVRRDGAKIPLSAKEFELLAVMAREPNRVFPLEELYRKVWHTDSLGDTRTLMVHVSNLRKKIEVDPSRPTWIQTVRGFGYRFCPDGESARSPAKEA